MRIEVDYLAERMHTCIGAPGALRLDRMCRDLRQRRVDGILNGAVRRLGLPTAEPTAVILESRAIRIRSSLPKAWAKGKHLPRATASGDHAYGNAAMQR